MRLNQYISSAGLCSRRKADQLIIEQRVKVNGEAIPFHYRVHEGDIVEVDGKLIVAKENNIYILFNKPPGIICTAAQHIEMNIIDYINYPERIFSVGRLDRQSEGLILLTNNGEIANQLLKEEFEVEKDYIVTVDRDITPEFIEHLSSGPKIYDPRKKSYVHTNPCVVVQLDERRFQITLSQGLNKQIRRMCRSFHYTVTTLQRIRMKSLMLGSLPLGEWRYLTEEEVDLLSRTTFVGTDTKGNRQL